MADPKETIETSEQSEQVVYELGYHLLPTLSQDSITAEVGDIKSAIEKFEGVFLSEEHPKSMRLAYTMVKVSGNKHMKFDAAFFGWIKFEMTPGQVVALKEAIDKKDTILRFIIVKTIREYTLLQPKSKVYTKPRAEVALSAKIASPGKILTRTAISDEELDKTIEELVSKQ
ncbi:30S ribosomal protein S6 [Patescibacteria group bacterium]|nr:30S ribosomal protein S6 [Patescibacteria group bacterium]